jgi:hypothetical protein
MSCAKLIRSLQACHDLSTNVINGDRLRRQFAILWESAGIRGQSIEAVRSAPTAQTRGAAYLRNVAATRFRAMELITILNRCHRFRGFVYQQAHFSADKKNIEVAVRPRKGSAAVCSHCHLPAVSSTIAKLAQRNVPVGWASSPAIDRSASQHGHDLLLRGFTVSQVVHDYGDVCQVISDLALEMKTPFSTDVAHASIAQVNVPSR